MLVTRVLNLAKYTLNSYTWTAEAINKHRTKNVLIAHYFMFGSQSSRKFYKNKIQTKNKSQPIFKEWVPEASEAAQKQILDPNNKSQGKTKTYNSIISQIPQENNLSCTLTLFSQALERIQPKTMKNLSPNQVFLEENQAHLQAIQSMKRLSLKDFSVLAHRLLVNYSGQNDTYYRLLWKQIEENYLERFHQTTCPEEIRSYSKILYSLAKVKINRKSPTSTLTTSYSTNLQNFQTKFALLLPFSTNQSFTTIATSLSRMGPLSQEFSYIIQKMYYQKYESFNTREKVQINYVMTRNGRKVDKSLYLFMDKMNLNQLVTMLRCYENCEELYEKNINGKSLLELAEPQIIARKKQMNVIDIGEICRLYFKGMNRVGFEYCISTKMEQMLSEMYEILKFNINDVTFEKIWEYLPQAVNMGYLKIHFVEEIIKTLEILKRKNMFPDRIWKTFKSRFEQFENQEIKSRLKKIV